MGIEVQLNTYYMSGLALTRFYFSMFLKFKIEFYSASICLIFNAAEAPGSGKKKKHRRAKSNLESQVCGWHFLENKGW